MRLRTFAWISALVAVASCVDNGNQTDPCPKYCSDIRTTCTDNDSQYPTTDQDSTCLRICTGINSLPEAGTNTIACRALNVSSAKDEPDPAAKHLDCVGAGVSAINCGSTQCAAFCAADLALCTGTNSPYGGDIEACLTACQSWGTSFDGQLLGSVGNTLQCRTYHLELSQTGQPSDLITHCAHTGANSQRCNAGTDAGTDAGPDATGDAASD